MSISSTILETLAPLRRLQPWSDSGCKAVGGIFRLDYARAVVLTDDWRKTQAGGVPPVPSCAPQPVHRPPKGSPSTTRN